MDFKRVAKMWDWWQYTFKCTPFGGTRVLVCCLSFARHKIIKVEGVVIQALN